MNAYETYKYNGLRNLLHGENEYTRSISLAKMHNVSSNIVDRTLDGLKSISDRHLIIIYRPREKNEYFVSFPDNYKGCNFVSGKLAEFDKSKLNLKIGGIEKSEDKNIKSDNNILLIDLEEIVDIIPKDNVLTPNSKSSDSSDSSNLLLFNFHSLDYGAKGHNLYNIINTDPVNAYLSANYTHNLPLTLSSIKEIYPGMQFNKQFNVEREEDVPARGSRGRGGMIYS